VPFSCALDVKGQTAIANTETRTNLLKQNDDVLFIVIIMDALNSSEIDAHIPVKVSPPERLFYGCARSFFLICRQPVYE